MNNIFHNIKVPLLCFVKRIAITFSFCSLYSVMLNILLYLIFVDVNIAQHVLVDDAHI